MVTAKHKGDTVAATGQQSKPRKIELCIWKITIHPKFDRSTLANDIAIVHVNNRFFYSSPFCDGNAFDYFI